MTGQVYPLVKNQEYACAMTGNVDRVKVITSVQRRRRRSAEEKARIVPETYAPGMSVSLVARQHGVGAEPSVQMAAALCRGRVVSGRGRRGGWWRRPNTGLCSTRCVNCNGCWARRRSRTRSCAKRLIWPSQKNGCCGRPYRLATTCREDDCRDARGGALEPGRAQAAANTAGAAAAGGPRPEDELLAEIKATIAGQPTYGYRRIHALIRRQRREQRRRGGERQAGLPGDEGARPVASNATPAKVMGTPP